MQYESKSKNISVVKPAADAPMLFGEQTNLGVTDQTLAKEKNSDIKALPAKVSASSIETSIWIPVCYALAALVFAALLTLVESPYRECLVAAFLGSFLLFLIPHLPVSSIGLVGLLACFGFLIHFVLPKKLAEKGVFLGIGFAFFAYAFAIAGGLAEGFAKHPEWKPLERYSTAFYEATQLPLMNMSPHDEVTDSVAKFYYAMARTIGCLFAYFVAYKTVVFVCDRARTQFLLGWYSVHSERPLALVIGLGTIGRRLIRNLLLENYRVVAIEADKDSVHIERAQDLGANVIVGDALDDRVYEKLPFNAAKSIYVVAGSDQKNLEIGQQLLSYSTKQVQQANLAKSANAPWWKRWCYHLSEKIFKDEPAVCHVQLYDSNMQQWMEREHFRQSTKQSHIEMRHFNAQQNAVRDLVLRELAKPEVRPEEHNEVGLYFIMGFEDLGQEVAIGIAQLAHFKNLKRSRIVVLCTDPKKESKEFLAKYPKFTAPGSLQPDWRRILFDANLDYWENTKNPNEEPRKDEFGFNFATNAIFTKAPISPSDTAFLDLVYESTKQKGDTHLKPCVIVCDKDVSKSFKWSSEFMDAWKAFAKRKNLEPECEGGTPHPSVKTYFWLQGHKALKELVEDNERHVPFGLEENCISTKLLDAILIRQLASVVAYSYKLATAKGPVEKDKAGVVQPVQFNDLKSDLHAAAHSLIKYQIAGGSLDSILERDHVALPQIGQEDSFEMDGVEYVDPKTLVENEPNLILTLGKMEHNRWMAEQLLKGYVYVKEEPPQKNIVEIDANGNRKEREVRFPQHEHERKTLCCWGLLDNDEKRKDLRQAYYVLYYLNAIATSNNTGE